jgi:hypothetical protein
MSPNPAIHPPQKAETDIDMRLACWRLVTVSPHFVQRPVYLGYTTATARRLAVKPGIEINRSR